MTATSAVVSSTLLRLLRQHAARIHDGNDDDESAREVSIGLLLGAQQTIAAEPHDAASATTRLAVYALLQHESDLESVAPCLPGGVSVQGHFAVFERTDNSSNSNDNDDNADDDTTAIMAFAQRVGSTRASRGDYVLVFVRATASVRVFHVSSSSSSDASARALDVTVVPSLHAQDFLAATRSALLRCALAVHASSRDALRDAVARWTAQLQLERTSAAADDDSDDDSDSVFFRIASSSAVLARDGRNVLSSSSSSSSSAAPLSAFVREPAVRASSSKGKKTKAKKSVARASDGSNSDATAAADDDDYLPTLEYSGVATIRVLTSLSPSTLVSAPAAPVLTIPASTAPAPAPVSLFADVLVLASLDAPVAHALALVCDELSKQLALLERRASASSTYRRVEAHHVALRGAAFPLTLVSPSPDAASERDLRAALLQPPHQPRFDPVRCSLVRTAVQLRASDVLLNVHEGVPASGVAHGEQYLVDGFYGYYHYMQQGVNDKGWGCAYRSLQTLSSWLALNHYAPDGAPAHLTHDAIQRTLVRIGDKPPSFIGSREWIGSMEVGYVLDEVYGVAFRSLRAATGPQLVDLAQELKHHFETQGTPVMMGGGQLAFTLLGIDYNAATGECAFLVLDPHYAGSDDLDVIQTKPLALEGYKAIACGWRRASTFAKNSFYNLCLPQRPHVE